MLYTSIEVHKKEIIKNDKITLNNLPLLPVIKKPTQIIK